MIFFCFTTLAQGFSCEGSISKYFGVIRDKILAPSALLLEYLALYCICILAQVWVRLHGRPAAANVAGLYSYHGIDVVQGKERTTYQNEVEDNIGLLLELQLLGSFTIKD